MSALALDFAACAPSILHFGRGDGRDGLIMDGFAGGGGASTAIEMATGRSPDFAWNHDPEALAMHAANHPTTQHFCQNIWQADFAGAAAGRPVWLAWFSPDCKHFSKAKGGTPVQKNIRDLAWVVLRCVHELGRLAPRIILLENVEEFVTWGPLSLDDSGSFHPDPARRGETFRAWCKELRKHGYRVEWRELRACDYGAPTIRRRLFLVARRDGEPITWPAPTHGPGLLPYRTAAECIDWSIPCPSIFLTREEGRAIGVNRPLAEATMRRIALGVQRYVIDAARPFIVPITHHGADRVHDIDAPLRTVTTANRGEFALAMPFVAQHNTGQVGRDVEGPLSTITHRGTQQAIVAAFLAQHNSGMVGHAADKPVSTIVGKGCTQGLVTSHLVKLRGTARDGQPVEEPVPTITAGGTHLGEVRAFLLKYYGSAIGQDVADPLHSVTTKPRFGLVTVAGEPYEIVDIGMRMLTPRELFRAQGFPESYIIDLEYGGKPLTKTAQNRMCGNSVSPPPAAALIAANCGARVEIAGAAE